MKYARDAMGPFYVAGAPEGAALAPQEELEDPGLRVLLEGRVGGGL